MLEFLWNSKCLCEKLATTNTIRKAALHLLDHQPKALSQGASVYKFYSTGVKKNIASISMSLFQIKYLLTHIIFARWAGGIPMEFNENNLHQLEKQINKIWSTPVEKTPKTAQKSNDKNISSSSSSILTLLALPISVTKYCISLQNRESARDHKNPSFYFSDFCGFIFLSIS